MNLSNVYLQPSVQFESSLSLTLQNTYGEEDDITDFEIGEPDCSKVSLLAEYPVIDTLNLDKPIIDINNEIVSDRALDNDIVPNMNDEKVVMVGSSSSVVNDPPLIDKNTPGCSKHCHTSDLYSSSEANALHLVLGGSLELKKYDMEKHLFKLGRVSLDTVNSLKYSLAKFQQQILKKASTLEVQFGNWERSFLSANHFCVPNPSDVEDIQLYRFHFQGNPYWETIIEKLENIILASMHLENVIELTYVQLP